MRQALLLAALLALLGGGAAWGEDGAEPEKPGEPKADPESQPYPLDEEGEGAASGGAETVDVAGTFVQIGLTLVLIILLIVGVGWVARRFVPGAQGLSASGPCRVVARLPIAPKAWVYLVQVGKRLLVVGYTGDSMRTLSEISEPGEVASLLAASAGSARGGFPSLFKKAVSEYGPPAERREDDLQVERVREELKRLNE